MSKMINLTLKELTVNAMPHLSVSAIQSVVQSELSQLLIHAQADRKIISHQQNLVLDDLQLEVNANASAFIVGQQLAQLIYQGIEGNE